MSASNNMGNGVVMSNNAADNLNELYFKPSSEDIPRVLLLGLYGRYRSSSSLDSTQFSICDLSAGVNAPDCSMVSRTVALRFSISANASVQCLISAIATSSRPPVLSFLYLLMNGIVAPSSKSLAQFSTCHTFTPTLSAILLIYISFISICVISD